MGPAGGPSRDRDPGSETRRVEPVASTSSLPPTGPRDRTVHSEHARAQRSPEHPQRIDSARHNNLNGYGNASHAPGSSSSTSQHAHQKRKPAPERHVPPDAASVRPPGTEDLRVMYDPALDAGPIKKGKEIVYRKNGAGLDDVPTDPRKATDRPTLERVARTQKFVKYGRRLVKVDYAVGGFT